MQMFASIKLRWRQAFLAHEGKCISMCKLWWPDALRRLAAMGRRGGQAKFTERSSLAFPGSAFEGSALGKRVRFPMHDVLLHFCFASFPVRVTPNSTPSRRF